MSAGRGVKRAKRYFFAIMPKGVGVKKWNLWHKRKCAERFKSYSQRN